MLKPSNASISSCSYFGIPAIHTLDFELLHRNPDMSPKVSMAFLTIRTDSLSNATTFQVEIEVGVPGSYFDNPCEVLHGNDEQI